MSSIEFIDGLVKYYEIPLDDIIINSSKSFLVNNKGVNYIIKETNSLTEFKYQFLFDSNAYNVLYPLKNNKEQYVSNVYNKQYYVTNYHKQPTSKEEYKIMKLIEELNTLHERSSIPKQLSKMKARPKFEELTKSLDFKFRMMEDFVRKLEKDALNDLSIKALGNYQYILNAKNELLRLEKALILEIKQNITIDHSYVHNRPLLNHLLKTKDGYKFISLDNGKIGLASLDYAKVYFTYHNYDLDFKTIFKKYLKTEFEYNYFLFIVLYLIIIKTDLMGSYENKINALYRSGKKVNKVFDDFFK